MTDSKTSTSGVVRLAAAMALLFAFRDVLWPLALAFVLSILIGALSRRLAKVFARAGTRGVLAVTAIVVGVLVAASMLVMVEGLTRLVAEGPDLYRRLDQLVTMIPLPGGKAMSLADLSHRIDIAVLAAKALGSVKGAAAGLALTLLYLVFLTVSSRMIEKRVISIIASRSSDTLVKVLERSVRGVEAYMYIQTITGLMIAIASGLVMAAFGLKHALFWTLALFLLSFLPVVGVLVGSLGPTLFALVQFPTLGPAIAILAAIQVISFVVGNLVLPKMQADSQNIDPTASLLAIGVWTTLWGIPGAFLAIPLTLAVMYALAQYRSLNWIAVLLSHDGSPLPTAPAPGSAAAASKSPA